ncbi:hypothetical protein [Pandoraea sp. NPDC090278]|uniref:hypothetical protein n=1 Tax=Pandoraea sp. NPDC090278 TaxID=3364391 RepID=UPI00383A3B7A
MTSGDSTGRELAGSDERSIALPRPDGDAAATSGGPLSRTVGFVARMIAGRWRLARRDAAPRPF